MTQRFQKAFDALTYAFLNNTLAKGMCAACAVGNIVGFANNCSLTSHSFELLIEGYAISGTHPGQLWSTYLYSESDINKPTSDECANTGYSHIEMAQVEKAFEKNTDILPSDYYKIPEEDIIEDQYNGLMAALKVLCELDNLDFDFETPFSQFKEERLTKQFLAVDI